jgi:CTP:molybdopterin cytidylyltransferase MocA
MLEHVVELHLPHVDHVVVVVNPSAVDAMEAWRGGRAHISFTTQASPTGMLDAILVGAKAVRRWAPHEIWISWADQVGVLPATLRRLVSLTALVPPPPLVFPTVRRPTPYIHFDRDGSGRIARLLQRREGDAMPAEGESDIGIFALGAAT